MAVCGDMNEKPLTRVKVYLYFQISTVAIIARRKKPLSFHAGDSLNAVFKTISGNRGPKPLWPKHFPDALELGYLPLILTATHGGRRAEPKELADGGGSNWDWELQAPWTRMGSLVDGVGGRNHVQGCILILLRLEAPSSNAYHTIELFRLDANSSTRRLKARQHGLQLKSTFLHVNDQAIEDMDVCSKSDPGSSHDRKADTSDEALTHARSMQDELNQSVILRLENSIMQNQQSKNLILSASEELSLVTNAVKVDSSSQEEMGHDARSDSEAPPTRFDPGRTDESGAITPPILNQLGHGQLPMCSFLGALESTVTSNEGTQKETGHEAHSGSGTPASTWRSQRTDEDHAIAVNCGNHFGHGQLSGYSFQMAPGSLVTINEKPFDENQMQNCELFSNILVNEESVVGSAIVQYTTWKYGLPTYEFKDEQLATTQRNAAVDEHQYQMPNTDLAQGVSVADTSERGCFHAQEPSPFVRFSPLAAHLCSRTLDAQCAPSPDVLFKVVTEGDIDHIREVISRMDGINKTTQKGSHILFRAVMKCVRNEVMRLLLDAGADVRTEDSRGNSVMHFWARATLPLHRHGPIGKMLLDAGADINAQRSLDGITPLHHVAAAQNRRKGWLYLDKAQFLLDHGADPRVRIARTAERPIDLLSSSSQSTSTVRMRRLLQKAEMALLRKQTHML